MRRDPDSDPAFRASTVPLGERITTSRHPAVTRHGPARTTDGSRTAQNRLASSSPNIRSTSRTTKAQMTTSTHDNAMA